MSRHLSPFFCPYCGDEAIRPYGEAHGEWQCESCRRAFALKSVKPTPAGQTPAEQTPAEQTPAGQVAR